MSRVVDYRVIQAEGTREIANAVKPFVAKGWEPLGRPFVIHIYEPELASIAQAIVKRESESKELVFLRAQLADVRAQLDAENGGVISESDAIAAICAVLS